MFTLIVHTLFKLITFTNQIKLTLSIASVWPVAVVRAPDNSHLWDVRLIFLIGPRTFCMKSPLSILVLRDCYVALLLIAF